MCFAHKVSLRDYNRGLISIYVNCSCLFNMCINKGLFVCLFFPCRRKKYPSEFFCPKNIPKKCVNLYFASKINNEDHSFKSEKHNKKLHTFMKLYLKSNRNLKIPGKMQSIAIAITYWCYFRSEKLITLCLRFYFLWN